MPEPSELATKYFELLCEEGFRPKYDSDGDIFFKFEGKTYYLFVEEDDPELIRIARMWFFSLDDENELNRAHRITDKVNSRFKLAKLFVVSDEDVCASVELLVESPNEARPLLDRALRAVASAIRFFVEEMYEAKEAEEAEDLDELLSATEDEREEDGGEVGTDNPAEAESEAGTTAAEEQGSSDGFLPPSGSNHAEQNAAADRPRE
jgi:hypothetical protein